MPTECSLEHFAFDNCPSYLALSYVWGQGEGESIIVDGEILPVTWNLYKCLRDLRHAGVDGWLWIDAICINQSDDAEKSRQVQQMRQIYERSLHVMAWVGCDEMLKALKTASEVITARASSTTYGVKTVTRPTDGSRLAWFNKEEQNTSSSITMLDPSHFMEILPSNPALLKELTEDVVAQLTDSAVGDHWSAYDSMCSLKEFFTKSLWNRIWILQEFASARELSLVDQTRSLSIQDLFIVWAVLYHSVNLIVDNRFDSKLVRNIKSMAPLMLQSCALPTRKSRTLFELLRATGGFCATDPRDKVFALSGIAADWEELGIPTNYSKPCGTVYQEVARALVEKYGPSILSFNAGLQRDHWKKISTDSLFMRKPLEVGPIPSWCPDWTLPSHHTIVADRLPGFVRFAAGGNRSSRAGSIFFSSKLGRLSLPAVRIGLVSALCRPIEVQTGSDNSSVVTQMFSDIRMLADEISEKGELAMDLEAVLFSTPITHQRPEEKGPRDSHQSCEEKLRAGYRILCQRQEQDLLAAHPEEAHFYLAEASRRSGGRALFSSSLGYIGLGPVAMMPGDALVIFFEADVPYVIRTLKNGNYQLVGEVYMHGVMYGEYLETLRDMREVIVTLQ